MFCPKCGTEYRPGFTECADCKVPLVKEPPAPPAEEPPLDLVTVFSTADPGLLSVAETLLDGAGIPYEERGEELEHVIIPPIVLPVEIRVPMDKADEAQEILRELQDGGPLSSERSSKE